MTHFRIRQGNAGDTASEPLQQIDDGPWPIRVGIVGADYPGLRPAFEVSQGDRVEAGQVVFTDRKHKQISFVAPISGTIVETAYGARRTLARVVIEGDDSDDRASDDQSNAAPLDAGSADSVRQALQTRGLWPAFRTRPFGLVPTPDAQPDAIFVNAVRAGAHKPDPAVVLEGRLDEFRSGLEVLTKLTAGDVHLCQDQGARLCPNTPAGVRVSQFSGSRAAALSGTHIHRLHPVGDDARVWTLGYQDVVAIGLLFSTGRHDGSRVIAINGARAARPRLIRVPLGADIRALTEGEATQLRRGPDARVLSGGAVTGRPAAFLGRHHDEVAIVAAERPAIGWRGEPATGRRALIPSAGLDRALPFDLMAVPLMRALAVGDTEAAHRLGCLELIEEDVALLTRRCTSGADYGSLLRDVLDEIAKDAA